MKPVTTKVLTFAVLPLCIIVLAYFCVDSIMRPVKFNEEKASREQVAIQILKDIRTLQVGFKSTYGHFSPNADSLMWFYDNGYVEVIKQIGSKDDSLAVLNTEKLKKKFQRGKKTISDEELFQQYYNEDGTPKDPEFTLVLTTTTKIPVKDTLCSPKNRPDFKISSIKYIPFSGKDTIIYAAEIKTVSGVKVPLFEACIPYAEKVMLPNDDPTKAAPYYYQERLLKGMNHQLIVNLCEERIDTERYPGLKVGSVTAPNNNAGNWE